MSMTGRGRTRRRRRLQDTTDDSTDYEEGLFNNSDVSAIEIVGSIGTGDYLSIAISDSVFEGNSAIGGYGGAISRFYTQDDAFDWMGKLEIETSTIKDN